MPQKCFFCGHDFTKAIKQQDPSFRPNPDYKVPGDSLPTEDEMYKALKIQDRYGSLEDAVNAVMEETRKREQNRKDSVDSTCEEI